MRSCFFACREDTGCTLHKSLPPYRAAGFRLGMRARVAFCAPMLSLVVKTPLVRHAGFLVRPSQHRRLPGLWVVTDAPTRPDLSFEIVVFLFVSS